MGHSQYDPAAQCRPAWNAGKTAGRKRPLTQKQIWAVRFFLGREGRLRDRALFDLAIDSKLRGCDLVKIKIGDIVSGPDIRTRAIVMQQKTGKPVQFELTADVRASRCQRRHRSECCFTTITTSSCLSAIVPTSVVQRCRSSKGWMTATDRTRRSKDRSGTTASSQGLSAG